VRLTTKGRYAVTAVLDLAIHQGRGPIALADIANRQGISLSYLEQLFAKLRKRGLVISVRGPGGGYNLAREPGAIYIAEVITAVDENVDTTRCGGAHDCKGDGPCLTHDLWMDLSDRIYGYLNDISLRDLVERGTLLETDRRKQRPTEVGRRNNAKVRLDPLRSTDQANA